MLILTPSYKKKVKLNKMKKKKQESRGALIILIYLPQTNEFLHERDFI